MALTYTADQTTSSSNTVMKSTVYSADEFFKGTGNVNQSIDTGRGNDRIEAGGGNDKAEGGEGDDYVDGGAGNDDISGGYGKDLLIGGSGNDFLRFDQNDFIDANGRGTDGGPGLQGRLGQGKIYDGGSGFDIMAVRDAGGNKANDGSTTDVAGFDRTFQFATSSNRDISGVEGIVVDYADDKDGGLNDLVRYSVSEIRSNASAGGGLDFVAFLGAGNDRLQLQDSNNTWTLTSKVDGAAGLSVDQVAMIKTAGRFGSDGALIDDLLNTYTFTNSAMETVKIYTDAESLVFKGVEYGDDGAAV